MVQRLPGQSGSSYCYNDASSVFRLVVVWVLDLCLGWESPYVELGRWTQRCWLLFSLIVALGAQLDPPGPGPVGGPLNKWLSGIIKAKPGLSSASMVFIRRAGDDAMPCYST